MDRSHFIDDLQSRIGQLFSTVSPLGKESPLRALLQQSLAQWELVSREDFEIHQQVLLRTREKLTALEKRVAQLEAQQKSSNN